MRTININELNLSVEEELRKGVNKVGDIFIPEDMRLLTFAEFIYIWDKHRKAFKFGGDDFDEIIQNPLNNDRDMNGMWNIWLSKSDNKELINAGKVLHKHTPIRGIRFCKEIK